MKWTALVVIAACGSRAPSPAVAPSPRAAPLLVAPLVTVADPVGSAPGAPPLLVLVDRDGSLRVAAGPQTWDALATFDPSAAARPIDLAMLSPFLREATIKEWTPLQALAQLGTRDALDDGDAAIDRTSEDPPPPEVEAERPSSRDQARAARLAKSGGIGFRRPPMNHGFTPTGEAEWGTIGTQIYPRRVANIVGEVMPDRVLAARQPAVVLAHPAARAKALIDTVTLSEGMIAVIRAGSVVPLAIQFLPAGDGHRALLPWTEIRVHRAALDVEAVPDRPAEVAWAAGPLDRAMLASAVTRATTHHARDRLGPIDVLVDPDVDAQRFVDVVMALDALGFRAIGIGTAPRPGEVEATLRGRRIPLFRLSVSTISGDLDRSSALRTLRIPALAACYTSELTGTAHLKLAVKGDGRVDDVVVTGIDAGFAQCVATAVRALTFEPRRAATLELSLAVAPDALP